MRRLSSVLQYLPSSQDYRSHLLAWGFALCLALLPVRHLLAQSAVIRPDPPRLDIGEGQVETIAIVLEGAQDVYAIDVQASFDPAVVEVVDADPNQEGIQLIPGDFVKPDFAVRNTADNVAGTLQYVVTQVNPTEPASGAGIVVSILFRGKALGAQSELTITAVQIADRRGMKLDIQPQMSALTVVAPKPETPTPTSVDEGAAGAVTAPTATTEVAATPSPAPVVSPTPAPVALAAGPGAPSGDESLLWVISTGALAGTIVLLLLTFLVLRRRRAVSPAASNGRNRQ